MAATRVTRTLVALVGLVVAAAALRFATLDLQSFWVDEGATVNLLRGDFGHLLDGIPVTEKTPPLYYVLAWLWTRPFGTGEIGVRSLSALAGVLTVPAAFALGRELVSERAGLVAAALVAFNPMLVWYSQEARAYALLVLLSALATLYGVRAAREREGPLWRWAAVSALALATHYFALFVIAPLALWILARRVDRRRALVATAAIAAAGVALLPLAIEQSENPGSNFIGGTALATRIAQVPKQFLLGFDAPLEAAFTIAALALAAAGAWLALRPRGRAEPPGGAAAGAELPGGAAAGAEPPGGPASGAAPPGEPASGAAPPGGARIALALAAAAIALPVAAALAGADFVLARNLIVALVPFAVLLAAGFASASRLGLALAAALAALSLATVLAVFARPEFQRDDWRGAAEAIGPARADRALVVNPIAGGTPLRLYLDNLEPYGEEFRPVSEIALVAVASRRPGETPRPPRPPSPAQPGFEVAERKETDTFTLVLLRAPAPVAIASAGLTALKLEPSPDDLAVTLMQRPSR